MRRTLTGHRGDLTVADAAARSGLSLADAEAGLRLLLVEVDSHLSATDQGELVYSFAKGLEKRRTGGFWANAWRFVRAGARATARVVVRSFVAVVLVGYAAVFGLLLLAASLVLSVAAEDGGPTEAAGYLLWGIFNLVVEALYWSAHPLTPYSAEAAFKGDRKKHTASFYAQMNNFFFGPPAPVEDPLAVTRRVLARIRQQRGRIGIVDVMKHAGVPRAEADALLAKLLLDYDGEVDVSEGGALLYRFEKLRKSAGGVDAVPPRKQPTPILPLTGNSAKANGAVIGLVLFNLAMGALGVALDAPALLGAVPFFGSLALLMLPLARAVARPFVVARQRLERAREAVRTRALGSPLSTAGTAGVTDDELTEAFTAEAERAPREGEITRLLAGVAEDIDVVPDGERIRYRFRDLEEELRALEEQRAGASEAEKEIGAVVFTSRE